MTAATDGLDGRRARRPGGADTARRRDGAADRYARAGSSTSRAVALGPGGVIAARGVDGLDPEPGDAVLFHTGWGAHWDDRDWYLSGEPGPGLAVARWLAERGVALTGCDTWSYGPVPAEDPRRPFEVPQLLNVHHGVFVVENLDLAALAADGVTRVRPDPHPSPGSAAPPAPGPPPSPSSEGGPGMTDHYDVIIIGTGAGGGTLAHRLAPTGKRILLLERGGYLPREPENWDCEGGLRQGALPHAARRGSTGTASAFTPHAAVLRRRQHEGLRRDPLPPARARLRRGAALRRRLAGLADLLRRLRALLRRGRAALPRPRPARARTRPSRHRSGPFPYPAVSHEPRIQQLSRRPRAGRSPPLPPPGGRRPRRGRSREGPLRALRRVRRLPVPHGRQGRRARAAACGRRVEAPQRDAEAPTRRSSGSRPTRRARR